MPEHTHHIVVGFSEPDQIRAGFDRLTDLAATGAVQVTDVEFVHSIKGIPSTVRAGDVDPGLAGYDGSDTRLLNQADLDVVADAIPVGSMAAVVLYSGPLTAARDQWTRDGATIIRDGTGSSLLG